MSWTNIVRNEAVLKRIKEEKDIIRTQTRANILMHPEKYCLQLVMQGKIIDRRELGRSRKSWLNNLGQSFVQTTESVFRTAANKGIIAKMVADVR